MSDDAGVLADLATVYLDGLAAAGIVLRRETAERMLDERVTRLAAGLGLDRARALAWYDAETVRGWAREAAAQLHDEQPANPLVQGHPGDLAPVGVLARCIEAAVRVPDGDRLAAAIAAALYRYPAMLLGGLAVVRCDTALLRQCADRLQAADPALARRCGELAAAADLAREPRSPLSGDAGT